MVDLTGYPRDAISLDWDLEADLGIDSIKRMQLIGELAEVLGLETAAEAQTTLTGLHTLRELLDYLENSETAGDGTPSAPNAEDRAYEDGLQQGRRHAASIRALLKSEATRDPGPLDVLPAAESRARLSPRELAELQGLADGSGVHVGNVTAYRLRRGVNPAEASPVAMGSADPRARPGSSRYVMTMVDSPHPAGVRGRRLTGAALVVGDNPVAKRLRQRLQEEGVLVHRLDRLTSAESAVAELERLWRGGIPHLFLAMGRDASALREIDARAWSERREQVLMPPFWLCQRWLGLVKKDQLMDEATLVGLTELGKLSQP